MEIQLQFHELQSGDVTGMIFGKYMHLPKTIHRAETTTAQGMFLVHASYASFTDFSHASGKRTLSACGSTSVHISLLRLVALLSGLNNLHR